MKRLWARLRILAARPLLVSQAASSAAGAVAVIIAGAAMPPSEFVSFSLLNLVASTTVGFARASLLQPALVQQRRDANARVPLRYSGLVAVLSGVVLAVASVPLGVTDPLLVALLGVSGLPIALHDWLRFRAIAEDRRWWAAIGDLLRLALVPVLLLLPHEAAVFQAWLGLSLLVPIVLLALRTPRLERWSGYSTYRRSAALQAGDFVAGQFVLTIPLFVLGGISSAGLIAGIRFAQTLLGPLNLVFAASTTDLIADAATRETHRDDRDLIRRARQLSTRLAGLAGVIVVVLVGGVALTGFELRGVGNRDLLLGLALIGATTITGGWAGLQAILLRLLHHHGVATAGRVALVLVTLAGFGIGYAIGGVVVSLVVGLLANALASPLALGGPAWVILRRRR